MSGLGVLLKPWLQPLERPQRSAGQCEAHAEDVAGDDRNVDFRFYVQQKRDAELLGQDVAAPQSDQEVREGRAIGVVGVQEDAVKRQMMMTSI